jgi:molybdate transport system ATP-binding protein
MAALLELKIRKKLKNFELEPSLELAEENGQVLVLFGPSGSGKSVTMKCIAGITAPDTGNINICGRAVYNSKARLNLRIQERRVGYVPQNYALFPHLSVADNIAFGLAGWSREKTLRRTTELLNMLQLQGLEKRYPRQLSGGQQQRVAFARAIAPGPDILLLDEPFSALDAGIRADLRRNLASLSRDLRLPVVFITHDLEEAYMLAGTIAVYDRGRVLQSGTREEIFYLPTSKAAARLVGIRNFLEGMVLETGNRTVRVKTGLLELVAQLPPTGTLPVPGSKVTVCIRPERISLARGETQVQNCLKGYIMGEVARGTLYTIMFKPLESGPGVPDLEIEIAAPLYESLKQGSGGWVASFEPAYAHLIF